MTPEQREKKRMAGRLGYQKALANCPDFHARGGQASVRYDMWNCPCHGLGLAGYTAHGNKTKGKKYRYWGQPFRSGKGY